MTDFSVFSEPSLYKRKKKRAEGEEKHKVQEELEEKDETDIAQRK